MSTLRQDRETQALSQQHTENITTYKQWIVKHPDIRDCDANQRYFEEYTEGFDSDPLTEDDFEFALLNAREGRLVIQRVKSEAEVVAEENARRKSLSMSELKALARSEAPTVASPTLPLEITLPGRKTPTDISTPAALKALAKTNMWAFKWLFTKYGSELMNERLGAKPNTQTGVSIRLPF